uniref:DUF86 domain-containing protein n=1 Tax=Meloidogyne hapla TaxID=6305 RepID=A0A1I8BRN2_MELHA
MKEDCIKINEKMLNFDRIDKNKIAMAKSVLTFGLEEIQNYQINCTTFSQVTRKLIFKDKALEEQLIIPFLAVMRDIELDIWKGIDECIDEILKQ